MDNGGRKRWKRVGEFSIFVQGRTVACADPSSPFSIVHDPLFLANGELDNLILTTAISIFIFAVAPTVSLNFDFVSNCMTILTGILSSFCSHHPLSDAMATYIWQWTTPTITDPYNQYFMYQLQYLESPPKIAVDPKNYNCENCSEHETIYSVLTQGL